MKTDGFIGKARQHLSPILNHRGAILYSSFSTLTPGKYYM